MKIIALLLVLVIPAGLLPVACGPIPDFRNLDDLDLHPPVFLDIDTGSAKTIIVLVNEEANFIGDPLISVDPGISSISYEWEGDEYRILIETDLGMTPGQVYYFEGTLSDPHGNRLHFSSPFYGYNPDIPGLLINEFTTRGSTTHPDLVELVVINPGNMAGICLYEGTEHYWNQRIIFPPLHVETGDFIVVHFKPQGIDTELNETVDKAASGGLDASDSAWDFWVEEGTGLSGNNGVLALYRSPQGQLLDGVLYSNRTSSSDTKYRGFGSSSTLAKAEELAATGGWYIQGETITPEDGVNPDGSTATRSLNRSSLSADTDGPSDWHIVPTSTYSFGEINSDEIFN